jgi:site-specific DNA-methyltransferase (adenine-specific)
MTIIREERIGGQRLILGDCLQVMPLLGRFDACVTDPPYGMKHPADSARFSGGTARRGRGATHKKIHGDDVVFDPAPLFGASKMQLIWGLNHFPQGLAPGSALVWLKRNDGAFGSFLSDAEVAWLSNGRGTYCFRWVNAGSKLALDWQGDAYAPSAHPTQKPLALMEWCLGFLPEARTILDPFMGSGTTLVACQRMGRSGTGIEIDPEYFAIACKRVDEAARQPDLLIPAPSPPSVQESLL